MHKHIFSPIVRAVIAVAAVASVAISGYAQEPKPVKEVVVFAAASMNPSLTPLAQKYDKDTGIKMVISYASSSALATQIQSGAPAQIFISADVAWAEKVQGSGHAAQKVDFLGNSLVLIVPAKGNSKVTKIEDLQSEAVQHIAIADPTGVPAGKYAKEAMETLGLYSKLEPKFVPTQDVRQALLYVERSEAEAGFVYATDATSSKAVKQVAVLDPYLKTPVKYAIVLTKTGAESADARAAYDFLLSDGAIKAFEKAGFTRPAAADASKN